MGCNMCVMEKAEESNKVLAQGPTGMRHGAPGRRLMPVSPRTPHGKEACKASQEQVAETLRLPRDPLVIQVMRRSPRTRMAASAQDPQLVDNGTQTEITFEHVMALSKVRPPSPPPIVLEPYVLSDLPPLVHDFDEANDYLDSGHHEVDRAVVDLEYEEVELYKERHQEKLGLTVCYRTDDENDTGIYIGEINPNGIAAKDGRIRTGDRIVQINGVEVQNRGEAVAILTREDSTNVSLLLARPEMELDEGWMEERGEGMDSCSREIGEISQPGIARDTRDVPAKHKEEEVVSARALCNSQELDSGVGRTDESTRNEESSEHDILAEEQWPGAGHTTPGGRRKAQAQAEGREGERLPGLTEEECLRYRELLDLRRPPGRGQPGSLAAVLSEELGHLEFKCRQGLRAQKMRQLRMRGLTAWLAGDEEEEEELEEEGGGRNKMVTPLTKADPLRRSLGDITEERSDRDTTSAYNTGESCRSTPVLAEPTAELSPVCARFGSLDNRTRRPAAGGGGTPPATQRGLPRNRRHRSPVRQSERYRSCVQLCPPRDVAQAPEGRGEWRVKVRGGDGSRHAARRPVRDKLLKARALKIREERSGVTTDDDAVSEMKMGRYWSKEARKQHLARAREQRRRREFMIQSRMDCLKEQQQVSEGIVALSHKKTARRRNRRILDNWMTIQEMLAHGTRTADGKRVYNPLLSVTTV